MEISSIKIYGTKTTVIFTGSQYIFNSDFYGVIAIATRVVNEKGYAKFDILCGNSRISGTHTDGTLLTTVKRFINKNECKYISTNVDYNVLEQRINNYAGLKIEVINAI